ncbi:putative carnitinyl-CoA dehydratase [Xylona heveae TC161]|uniref:Putative carnitinyl-CoA dehydratase n=1 Tax=Xylona heveae (strain CBS 132557 / TC161) TaxID=1328760 RepID=A0A165H007_XYLHT|nr:putative carnitinyl-CoA dehydratase [Xylona heveae TC161]KZF22816.1 putative carnitinyl-CoA dehydratase [Xylona heveae TC161]
MATLFTIPISSTLSSPDGESPGSASGSSPAAAPPGSPTAGTQKGWNITVTQPSPKIYFINFGCPPDNRLSVSFCNALLLALDILEFKHPRGVIVTTSAIPKFYSNGLEIRQALSMKGGAYWEVLYSVWRRLLTYPMPTIALINGHAFAGGLMLAMMHDYRIQNPHRGFLCLNEIELGMPLKPPMSSIFRQKVTSPGTYRTLVLEAKRFGALESLKEGLVDGLGGVDEVLTFIEELKLLTKTESPTYGILKEEMWRETVAYLDNWEGEEKRLQRSAKRKDERMKEAKERIGNWENAAGKSKL